MKTKEIIVAVCKRDVYNEVAKTTAYAGSKQMGTDEQAYDRVFTTDDDRLMLERYFAEASKAVTESLPTSYIDSVSDYNTGSGIDLDADYQLTLRLPVSFPDALTGSVQATLHSFFVTYIIGQWLTVQKDETAAAYIGKADIFLGNIPVLLSRRTRPTHLKPRPF